jgi:hypothetical protein
MYGTIPDREIAAAVGELAYCSVFGIEICSSRLYSFLMETV